ncbi:hypothetical protein RND71_026493 [Anisodus tanguticus]|uniref:Uncharacterized protein n=1 Tax=Anisodus tanguticus TaxID=243964 RepID=A0AAE1RKX3_9SOLA|nr:hypothetical protein RND71_026493 [Anisodus tanguticus]
MLTSLFRLLCLANLALSLLSLHALITTFSLSLTFCPTQSCSQRSKSEEDLKPPFTAPTKDETLSIPTQSRYGSSNSGLPPVTKMMIRDVLGLVLTRMIKFAPQLDEASFYVLCLITHQCLTIAKHSLCARSMVAFVIARSQTAIAKLSL